MHDLKTVLAYNQGYADGLSEKPRDIEEQLNDAFKHGYVKGLKESKDLITVIKLQLENIRACSDNAQKLIREIEK